MRIRLGCRFDLQLTQPTPMIALLNVHFSRAGDLEAPDRIVTTPSVPLNAYRDMFGNWCTRLVAPAGVFSIGVDAFVHDSGAPDEAAPNAAQIPVELLPDDSLIYLMGSRYCDTDLLSDEAWRLFEHTRPGWQRVQAICNFVHNHIQFDYMQARATRSASEAYSEGVGVCRDYTHLAITFCRCMNIPARYCTGYLGDIGTPPPYPPGDFAAWMEVFLDGSWWTFDPRNNTPRIGRILVARGRDAADVPLLQSFGRNVLNSFEVWTDEID
ncbi:Transglutaminase-like enzyme, putative cysteine protease [Thalassovita litoralis]|uniref:Transglutaminase-like enzyme, putative cysteine protease n=1 Tax=Thalassovita litoralis TaxID=1010611 RepID=A0A521FB31_9RHOB|nr:transglutaminase family protein [Thalassovita litoralis]SMO93363.1 Transglutaminase-like enzyme, putative cysteine protease [Thalassovita litoralis]